MMKFIEEAEQYLYRRSEESYPFVVLSNLIYNVAGHADYGKFVVISSGRSGSALLVSYLNSHPNIRCYSEIFQEREFQKRSNLSYPKDCRLYRLFAQHPEQFLQKHFFCRYYPKQILWVGFKIFYLHTRLKGQKSTVWPYLADNKEFKIIHLKRKNLLAQYRSFVRALQTDVWWTTQETPEDFQDVPVKLQFNYCLMYFKSIEYYRQEMDVLFRRHDRINIYYEDLVSEKDEQLKRVQDLLEIPYQELGSTLKKQSHSPLSQSIINYAELKRRFVGTKYEEFFTG